MKKLSIQEIEKFSNRSGVKKIAVENFLMSMGTNETHARLNLQMDGEHYKWNWITYRAIEDGIKLANKGV